MSETPEAILTVDEPFKRYIPIITVIICLASIVLFIGINLEDKPYDWDTYKRWGSPFVSEIFNGSYWGLISSNFLHTEIWHIVFNLYWLWIFGKKVEFETNKIYFGIFILSSALVSSASQLAFSDSTGIGLSGIGYALFGFLFIKSKTPGKYENYLNGKTINLFLVWLVLCIVLTKTKAWNVGNAAHIGGLLWGMTLAYISRFQKGIQLVIGSTILLFLTSMIFWSPFSTAFLTYKVYELHKDNKIDEAIVVYNQILERDAGNEFAKENLKQIEIQKLCMKAYDLHQAQKFEEAGQVYNEILKLDPGNAWAKENISRLPKE